MTLTEKIFGVDAAAQKADWQALQARVKALPKDFRASYKAMQKYLFDTGLSDWHVLAEVLDLLELAVLDGRDVTAVVGKDVASFCDALTADKGRSDWRAKHRQALNDYFAQRTGEG